MDKERKEKTARVQDAEADGIIIMTTSIKM